MTEQHTKQKKEHAVIFDIQRFSLQDGPGIRTTVFLKGCPLSCIWCHNPESWLVAPQLMYHSTMCVGCMKCVEDCPNHAHIMKEQNGNKFHDVDWSKCSGCGECIKVCNYDALSLMGKEHTPETLYEKIKGDILYFNLDTNGEKGGITFSGGEPMLYYRFIKAFKKLASDIHIALETSGYAPTQHFAKLKDIIDLYLFDYKATNESKHQNLCGVSNKIILENLDYLCLAGNSIILRLPLIPDVNDEDEHLRGIAALLKKYPQIKKAQVMPYHTLGVNKRDELGMYPQTWGDEEASEEKQKEWIKKLNSYGAINVEISK